MNVRGLRCFGGGNRPTMVGSVAGGWLMFWEGLVWEMGEGCSCVGMVCNAVD